MSKFSHQETVFRDGDVLCATLTEMGFKPEQHEEAVHLYGYHGDIRPETAHIVIPRSQVGRASNDIGFTRLADGRYTATISEYDSHKYGRTWINQLSQKYRDNVTMKVAAKKGYKFIGRTVQNGTIKLQFLSR